MSFHLSSPCLPLSLCPLHILPDLPHVISPASISSSLLSASNEGGKDVAEWEAALQEELAQLTLEGGEGEGEGEVEGVPEDTEAWEKELAQLLEPMT